MPERTIESLYDIDEDDVRHLEAAAEFVAALGDYASSLNDEDRKYEPRAFRRLAEDIEQVYQEASIIVAAKQHREMEPEDLLGGDE